MKAQPMTNHRGLGCYIADTTPPDSEFGRILYLIEQCQAVAQT